MNNYSTNNIISFIFKRALIIIILASLYSSDGIAQKKSVQESLIGTWSFDFDKSIGNTESDSRAHFNNMEQSKKNKIRNSFGSRKIIFQSGGRYSLEIKSGSRVNGTWELLDDDQTLIVRFDDGNEFEQQIEKITSSSLRLDTGEDPSQNKLFSKWHLTKTSN